MPDVPKQPFETRLLDLHLGHLTEAEQAELRQCLAGDAQLAAQDAALASVFRALQIAPEPRMPVDLAARVSARVRAAGPSPRVVRPADELTRRVEGRAERIIRLGSLRDIIGIAALIVFAVGVGVPGMLYLRERQQRLGCSRNLAALGFGVQQYANSFGASLPFAGFGGPRHSWKPTSEPGVVTVPNHRHVYPLLRMAFVADPGVFLCPSQQHVPMPRNEIARRNDFLESRNLSYAYQNMAGVRPATSGDPRLPILGDENPLFDEGWPLFDVLRATYADPATANSRAHRGAGQNILTLDGHVKWATTPNCGIDGDNIWTLPGVTDYTGREGPVSATDSHLLK
jgi:hypothetical protein